MGVLSETHSIECRCVAGPENTLFCRRIRASFSPEILQDGAVKGLKRSTDAFDHNTDVDVTDRPLDVVRNRVASTLATLIDVFLCQGRIFYNYAKGTKTE